MMAHLYIVAESFQNNSKLSDFEIEEKVKRLSEDIVLICKHKESNKLYANFTTTYPQQFYSNFTVYDFICNTIEVKKHVDRDVINAMQKIFEKAENTTISTNEVKGELLTRNDENNCHGLIAFHKIEGIKDEVQLIYGIDRWYHFRQYFLGLFPRNSGYFIDECNKYFPKLLLHEQNKASVASILNDFAKSIVKHLGYLNDIFYTYRYRTFDNESVKYKTFTSECKLEEKAASKDNNSSKGSLTFTFINKDKHEVAITCYPHLRLCNSDNASDSRYYQNRIYFHEGIESICNGNILIGHIGGHL